MIKKLLIFMTMLAVLSVSAMAVELNNSYINSTGLNLSINVTKPIYFDVLTVGTTGIYFEDLRQLNASVEGLTFNMTQRNTSYRINTTLYQLPYFSSAEAATTKTILSNMTVGFNATATLSVDCTQDSGYDTYVTGVECDTCTVSSFTCSGTDIATVILQNLDPGTNTLTLTYSSSTVSQGCTGIFDQLGSAFILAAVVLIVFVVGIIAMALNGQFDIKGATVILVVGAILLIIGYLVIAKTYVSIC